MSDFDSSKFDDGASYLMSLCIYSTKHVIITYVKMYIILRRSIW